MNRRQLTLSTLLTLLALSACARPAMRETGFAGTWIMTLGSRVFIVVTLHDERGAFTGQFVHPEQMQTGDGVSFSKIGGPAVEYPITRGSLVDRALRFTVVNPKDASDADEYEMTLAGSDEARLTWVGVPIALTPLPLRRHRDAQPPGVATDWDPLRTYYTELPDVVSSKEMDAIFTADQEARQRGGQISPEEWKTIEKTDAERRLQTRALLDKGALQTGDDFRKAAFIFQHGNGPKDYLLAHTLALVAMAKGDRSAAWIASATLDRYLRSVKQPQVYGTQFGDTATWQTPFDRDLVSDALRQALGVPKLAAQEDLFKTIQQQLSTAGK